MWSDIALLAVSGIKQLVSYNEDVKQHDLDAKWQAYNNAMIAVQDAGNQNNITTNENLAVQDAAKKKYAIRQTAYKTRASAEVAAAASGTGGRSVDIALFDIGRNEAMALEATNDDLAMQYLQFDNQRVASSMQAKMSHDFRGLPTPNPATYMLGFASDAASIMTK